MTVQQRLKEQLSTTLARTQPDVVAPVTISVSTDRLASQLISGVPKNAEGPILLITRSPAAGASSGVTAAPWPAWSR